MWTCDDVYSTTALEFNCVDSRQASHRVDWACGRDRLSSLEGVPHVISMDDTLLSSLSLLILLRELYLKAEIDCNVFKHLNEQRGVSLIYHY